MTKMPMSKYLAIKAFSSGMVSTILSRSPMHAWLESPWNPQREDEPSAEADLGTYAHAMLLEGGMDALEVVNAEKWSVKCEHAGVEQVAWKHRETIRACGKLAILAHQVNEVARMVSVAHEFLLASELKLDMTRGVSESVIQWNEDGIECKIRPDWLAIDGSVMLSYKTTENANPEAWIRRTMLGQGYDTQLAFYSRGSKAEFSVHLVQETKPPYACSLIGLTPQLADIADARINRALSVWDKCMAEQKFPTYSNRVHYAEAPAWVMAAEEMAQLTDEDLEGGIPL